MDGKETCVLIDNVGLYHIFGLPTAYRDWQAMFEGRMAGKGYASHIGMAVRDSSISIPTVADNGLELIVSHDNLMKYLNKNCPVQTIRLA